MKPFALCVLLTSLLAAPSAQSQTNPAPPCTSAEATQLDFWVGTWALSWDVAPGDTTGDTGRGMNAITKELGGCVVQERFEAESGYAGTSVSVYAPRAGRWRQTWVDNQGGYIALTGGPNADGAMELRTEPFTTPQGQTQVSRMTWADVSTNALTWRWQRSLDGGQTWENQWVIRYARR